MKSAIEISTKVHVKVTGPIDDMGRAINALYDQGWRVTRSGPLSLGDTRLDSTQFELHAEHTANSDQHQLFLAMDLRDVLP